MLSLENTASRMSHLARQEIYFDRQFGLDETLEGVERVTAEDLQRVARDLFSDGGAGRDGARAAGRLAVSAGAARPGIARAAGSTSSVERLDRVGHPSASRAGGVR